MQYLKADTNTEVLIGPVVAVGDGFTPVTTLSLSTADEAEIIKYGGATPLTVTSISANGFAAITSADGYYTLDISTSNSDTEGFLTVLINDDSLCLPVRVDFMVVNANVYDSLFAAATTDYLQTDVAQWLGTAAATPTTAGVPEVDVTFVSGTAQTANDNGADINAILVDTAEIGAAGAGLTAVPYNAAWDAEIQSEVNDGLVAFFTSAANLVDLIWDEVLTGATHNVVNSSGRRLRQIEASFVITAGTAQAGAAGTITLAAGESATDDIFNGDRVIITSGTGVGEHGMITDYNGTTKVATMSKNWVITPDATSEYELVPADVDVETWNNVAVTTGATSTHPVVDAQAISDDTTAADNLEASASVIVIGACEGTPSTTVIQTDLAEATDDHYIGRTVVFTSGVCLYQGTDITDYTGSTGTITVTALTDAPSAADTFVVI